MCFAPQRRALFRHLNFQWGCEDVDQQMWGCEDVDLQAWRCEDVDQQMWSCEDVDQQMCRCEDVLQRLLFYEEPFAGALGKKQPSSYRLSHRTWSPAPPWSMLLPHPNRNGVFFEGLSKQSAVTTLNWGKGGMQVSSQWVWQDGCFLKNPVSILSCLSILCVLSIRSILSILSNLSILSIDLSIYISLSLYRSICLPIFKYILYNYLIYIYIYLSIYIYIYRFSILYINCIYLNYQPI